MTTGTSYNDLLSVFSHDTIQNEKILKEYFNNR